MIRTPLPARPLAFLVGLALVGALLPGCASAMSPATASEQSAPVAASDDRPSTAPTPPTSEPASATATASVQDSAAPSASASSASAPPSSEPSPSQALPLDGRLVVIDPGHNGVWTRKLLKKVPAGNGRTKPCNSSGTATNNGYAEHAYNWSQAHALADELRARGAEVLFTRANDTSQGPCVNLRSRLANQRQADVLFSIHADGSFAKGARGFHVIISTTMVGGAEVEKESRKLATSVRSKLESETAMPRSTYIGRGTALSPRTDIATLNLSHRVGVMMEMGNMRNAKDAALLKSSEFRHQAAVALADGIAAYLG